MEFQIVSSSTSCLNWTTILGILGIKKTKAKQEVGLLSRVRVLREATQPACARTTCLHSGGKDPVAGGKLEAGAGSCSPPSAHVFTCTSAGSASPAAAAAATSHPPPRQAHTSWLIIKHTHTHSAAVGSEEGCERGALQFSSNDSARFNKHKLLY